jgi:hypothetical protein
MSTIVRDGWGFSDDDEDSDQAQADVYERLRQQVLSLTPDQLGPEFAGAPVLALLMETA